MWHEAIGRLKIAWTLKIKFYSASWLLLPSPFVNSFFSLYTSTRYFHSDIPFLPKADRGLDPSSDVFRINGTKIATVAANPDDFRFPCILRVRADECGS